MGLLSVGAFIRGAFFGGAFVRGAFVRGAFVRGAFFLHSIETILLSCIYHWAIEGINWGCYLNEGILHLL